MEIQNIIISNKLIAKFMQYNDVDCHNCKYSRDCNWIQCGLTEQEKDEQLLYHSSWDWLMPVCIKLDMKFVSTDIVLTFKDVINQIRNIANETRLETRIYK